MQGTPAFCGARETRQGRGGQTLHQRDRSCSRRARYSPAATVREADPAGESLPRRGAGARRGADVTTPPPQLLQEGGSGERSSDPPQLPAPTPKLGGSLLGLVLTNLTSSALSLALAHSHLASFWCSSFTQDGSLWRCVHLGPGRAGGSHSRWEHAEDRRKAKLVFQTQLLTNIQIAWRLQSCQGFKAEHRGLGWTDSSELSNGETLGCASASVPPSSSFWRQ